MHEHELSEDLARALATRGTTPRADALYQALRGWIEDGRLAPGRRLPASRGLASDLGLGRNTVLAAMDRLVAEEFVESVPGAGLYVSALAYARSAPLPAARHRLPRLSNRGAALMQWAKPSPLASAPFRPGLPALDLFPWADWQRRVRRHARRQAAHGLGYPAAGGHPALKAAIADYAQIARGVRCAPSQVLVTHGAQHAFDLVARMLADPGEIAWVENPGYAGARAAFAAAGLQIVSLPVDDDGLDTTRLPRAAPRLMHLTPSNQFPCGGRLSLARRQALIALALRHDAWIVEDDYDSEFRYSGAPLSAMQGLVGDAPVLYVGTFSKTLYPALRLGYLIMPTALVEALTRANARQFREPDYATQAALAAFMADGGFSRHVARMRRAYRVRKAALREALSAGSQPVVALGAQSAGLHLVAHLRDHDTERAIVSEAAALGMALSPLGDFGSACPPGLVLGYANSTPGEIALAGRWLKQRLA